MSGLEDRYRRLLRWYPADHRRAHEDEMLGVLLAAAAPTRTRPAVRDALGLALGGLGVRLRRAPGVRAESGRRDAAGLLGVIAPLLLLGEAVRYAVFAILMLPEASYAAAYGARWSDMYSAAPAHLAWAVVAVAGLRGARRTTAVAVLAAIALDVVRFADLGDYAGEAAAGPLLLGLITAGALLAEPGTARGRVLPGRTDVGIAGLLAVVAPLDPTSARAALGIDWGTGRVGVTIAALAAATWMARGPAGRRALILLAMPLLPFVAAPYYPGYSDDPLGRYLITMVVIPVAIGLTALGTIVAAEKLSRVAE